MKNIIIVLLSVLLMISISFNIFNNNSKDYDLEKFNKSLIGIYQTTYYNNYYYQMILTIGIKENESCLLVMQRLNMVEMVLGIDM